MVISNYSLSCSETSHPRRYVNNKASKVINNAHFLQPSIWRPYAKCINGVRESKPKWHKQHPCIKIHPPKQCPSNQNQCDSCKHNLEINHCCIWQVQHKRNFSSKGNIGSAYKMDACLAKRHLTAPTHPAYKHSRKGVKGHEGRVHGPFLFYYATVEDNKARNTL